MRGLAQRCIEQAGRQGQSSQEDRHVKWQTVHFPLLVSEADPLDLQIVYSFNVLYGFNPLRSRNAVGPQGGFRDGRKFQYAKGVSTGRAYLQKNI